MQHVKLNVYLFFLSLFSPVGSPDPLYMEDKFLTNTFNLLLDLLQGSTPRLHGSEIEHFRVSEISIRLDLQALWESGIILLPTGQGMQAPKTAGS